MIRVNVITHQTVSPRMEYVLDYLNDHPVLKEKIVFRTDQPESAQVSIYYGPDDADKMSDKVSGDFYIKPQNLFFGDIALQDLTTLHANRYRFQNTTLYAVEAQQDEDRDFINAQNISFDIFEMIFFHISRIEETIIKLSDHLQDKLQFENQLFLIKHELEKKAVVDDIALALYELLTKEKPVVAKYKILSHDIDHIQLFKGSLSIVKKTGGVIYRDKGLAAMKALYSNYKAYKQSGKDPYDTFDWMLESTAVDKRIYFLVGGKHSWDSVYDLEHPIFKSAIASALENQYGIGIHPSYESWNNPELIKDQKTKLEDVLNKEVQISRQHFLNFDIETTPALLLAAGIVRDSSLGYTRYTGYRCGTAYPYTLYDFRNETASRLITEPLVFMDMAWFYEAERTGSRELQLDQFNGCFNFHNSFFFQAEQQGIPMREAYLSTFGS